MESRISGKVDAHVVRLYRPTAPQRVSPIAEPARAEVLRRRARRGEGRGVDRLPPVTLDGGDESRSPLFWLVRGYAILDNPMFPIVGEGDKESNDTYVQQLVDGAKAAVQEVVRRGVADPNRIAIGGHSYGAFTTANLLAHSDLFRAGIARSGAYNRTLTPFGFQREERTFWDAPRST